MPVTVVEHLVLSSPEESFTRGIIRRTSSLGHGSDQGCLFCDLNPFRPTIIVTTSVGVNNWIVFAAELGYSLFEHCIGKLCRWTGANGPAHGHAVITINDR